MHSDLNLATPTSVLGDGDTVAHLLWNIAKWGIQRNITSEGGASALSQVKKLKEEVLELETALSGGDTGEVIDGIGDSIVVLVQIARLAGYPLDYCLEAAWDEIKDRKGTMVNGVFVKEKE